MATQTKALNLGQLQDEVIKASKAFKAAQSARKKAEEAEAKAEAEHVSAQKAFASAVSSVMASTKVV